MRTNYCGKISAVLVGQKITLAGWVNSYRDHGELVFIDLRDHTGLVQLVCDPADSQIAYDNAKEARDESVIIAVGRVRKRAEGLENPRLENGDIEDLKQRISTWYGDYSSEFQRVKHL